MNEPASTSPPKRPWYRLHLSTWFVVLLTLGVMTLIVVPGSEQWNYLTDSRDIYFSNLKEGRKGGEEKGTQLFLTDCGKFGSL